jgi:cysteine desulfurase
VTRPHSLEQRSPSIYLDHSATTPLAPEVLEAMMPYLTDIFGNASGAYALGRKARCGLEEARATVARCLGCSTGEVIFTSGGSESDNLALRGASRGMRETGRGHHVITSAVEHEAVLATAHDLEEAGFEVTILGVDHYGQVRVADVMAAVRPETCLVSLMMANNEVGTVQPIAEIGRALKAAGADVLLHSDAVQAPAWLEVDVEQLGVDMMSLSAHKFYGPKGVGLLYVRDGVPLHAAQTGGGQEHHLRAGTENVAGAVGAAAALERAVRGRAEAVARIGALRDRLVAGMTALPDVRLTGHPTQRMAHHASLCIGGVPADVLLMGLDMRGICASSGSACSAGKVDPSHVLLAMGVPEEEAVGALRLSLGRHTSEADIDRVLDVLPRLITRARSLMAVA